MVEEKGKLSMDQLEYFRVKKRAPFGPYHKIGIRHILVSAIDACRYIILSGWGGQMMTEKRRMDGIAGEPEYGIRTIKDHIDTWHTTVELAMPNLLQQHKINV